MGSGVNSIHVHRKLLNLYTSTISQDATYNLQSIVNQLSEIRKDVLALGDRNSITFYTRYLKLLSLQIDDSLDLSDLALPMELQSDASKIGDRVSLPLNALPLQAGEGLPGITDNGADGVSLVTCCKNRCANLMKALPSWLHHKAISEILIIDWDSDIKVEDELKAAGLMDSRIRIIRIEDEPHWILSYAFNVGFRVASFNQILKVDADIVLADDFFDKNPLPENTFIAGNWRNVTSDQNYVNGFFYTFKRALHQVAGFNEHITTYGWDDDDLYERLVLSGFTRKDVVSESVFHLPHSDEERASDANFTGGQTALAELEKGTRYLIRRNRYITHLMPGWGQNSVHVPFQIKTIDGPIASLRRQSYVPSAVPQHIQDTARFHTLLDFTSWHFGQRARELDREKLAKVLERPMADLSRIDIEVALTDISQLIKGRGHYVILSFMTSTLAQIAYSSTLASIIKHLRSNGLTPVFSAPVATFQVSDPSPLKDLVFVPSWLVQNSLPDVRLQAVLKSDTPADTDFIVKITEADLEEWRISRPLFVRQQRPKLFIDAQHGLGNRLRAIGSASAIAQATDRELVIVWEPDHHCQCAFSDLFEYSGEVIEKSFVEDARAGKSVVYNYMPNEPEMEKGRLIDDTDTRDIYARSAFTLNSPHSHWESENRFLKQLSPVAPVRNLVNSVRHPNAVSVHVRMETEVGREQNTYDRVENWTKEDHELIHHWRAKSHFSHFLTKIDQLITGGMADTVFLAADLPETYDAFKDKYGHRLAYLPRQLYDRSARQLHYALADAILLSRAPLLLGSTWSSFSELAMRLAPEPITVKMSGKDF